MSTIKLNLARKWRSRTFDEVVGQELPIRMLKNSLYLDHYFPVYLFSGQRGCGKTTAARIFAAAVNCEKLFDFQKNPKITIPCRACTSCTAMTKGNHPDFIEIDAASHTGVDNVRNIIDAASLMPLLGRKKIYLIDEAHMLSKAAFNAFLKILEEPPESVFFILATTDPQKIIATVTSRCFQVFFKALSAQPLIKHLAHICTKEDIAFQEEGLQLLVKQTEGSVRDALNLLEQVRFTVNKVDKQGVLTVLGHLDEERLLVLFDCALNKQPAELLAFMQKINFESYAAPILWHALIDLVRSAMWHQYGVARESSERLPGIIKAHSAQTLTAFLQLFYDYEMTFLKTRGQHKILEHILLQMCTLVRRGQAAGSSTPVGTIESAPVVSKKPEQKREPIAVQTSSNCKEWQLFLENIVSLNDPLVLSVFKQGSFIGFKNETVFVSFPENLSFFNELLDNTQNGWKPLLSKSFGQDTKIEVSFDGQVKQVSTAQTKSEPQVITKPVMQRAQAPAQKAYQPRKSYSQQQQPKRVYEKPVDVSDETKWKKANIILKVFPGTVTEVPKDEHA